MPSKALVEVLKQHRAGWQLFRSSPGLKPHSELSQNGLRGTLGEQAIYGTAGTNGTRRYRHHAEHTTLWHGRNTGVQTTHGTQSTAGTDGTREYRHHAEHTALLARTEHGKMDSTRTTRHCWHGRNTGTHNRRGAHVTAVTDRTRGHGQYAEDTALLARTKHWNTDGTREHATQVGPTEPATGSHPAASRRTDSNGGKPDSISHPPRH